MCSCIYSEHRSHNNQLALHGMDHSILKHISILHFYYGFFSITFFAITRINIDGNTYHSR